MNIQQARKQLLQNPKFKKEYETLHWYDVEMWVWKMKDKLYWELLRIQVNKINKFPIWFQKVFWICRDKITG